MSTPSNYVPKTGDYFCTIVIAVILVIQCCHLRDWLRPGSGVVRAACVSLGSRPERVARG